MRETLQLFITDSGLSQSQFAKVAGISQGHLSRILSGKRPMTVLMQSHLERVISNQCVSNT
jgi:transcriptional regulator with XRE-family HTH domain